MTLTNSQRRALEIVRDHPGIAPREFAEFMWPDSDGHSNLTNCGRGVTRGGGMNLAGGGYLGKLCRKGLVYRSPQRGSFGYCVSSEGSKALTA
ncbi:MAG TPA: hypothetical protein VFX97_17120 [Pyrinomonadaceae bacterium]|nr:hypothetical protein [Pyrinomonadaceae bacterium]